MKNSDRSGDLEALLRRHLLDKNPAGPDGESLMEAAAETVWNREPLATPSPAKEQEMLQKLKEGFANPSVTPGPAAGSGFSLGTWGMVSVVAVLSLSAILLLLNPFGTKNSSVTEPSISTQYNLDPALSDHAIQNQDPKDNSPEINLGDNDTLSLLTDRENGKGEKGELNRQPRISPSPFVQPRVNTPPLNPSLDPVTDGKQDVDNSNVNDASPSPLLELYAETKVRSEYLQIDPGKDHLIRGKKGTLIHIPSNCFVGSSGEAVSGNVQIEVREVYNKSEYLRSNLPTVSNGRQLVSGGVIYIDAVASGRRLEIAKGKDIYVEFAPKTGVNTQDMQLFEGQFNERGEMNWVPVGGETEKMIPLPMESLHFEEFWCEYNCNPTWNKLLRTIAMDDALEKTWIMTREFRQRLAIAWKSDHMHPILELYLNNTHLPLHQVDRMVAEKVIGEYRDFSGRSLPEYIDEYYQRFAMQMLTEIEKFDDRGVKLERSNARNELKRKGVKDSEIDQIMRVYRLRQQYVGDMEKAFAQRERKNSKNRPMKLNAGNSSAENPAKGYLIEQTGWTNLDKFVDNSFIKRNAVKLKVKLKGDLPDNNMNTFLVFKGQQSILAGRQVKKKLVEFRNLPYNSDAYLVTIGYRQNTPYYAISPVNLTYDQTVKLEVKRSNVDGLLKELKKLDH